MRLSPKFLIGSFIADSHHAGDGVGSGKILIQSSLSPVPNPARETDRIDSGPSGKLVDGNSRKRVIAAPFAFTRHHEIEVERMDESHAFCAHIRIDADECFVQQDEARRKRIRGSIKSGGSGESEAA